MSLLGSQWSTRMLDGGQHHCEAQRWRLALSGVHLSKTVWNTIQLAPMV